MSLRKEIEDLAMAVREVSQGINAMEAMAMGLEQAQDPYADGFNAICTYLFQANEEVHKHLKTCLNEI